MSSKTDLVGLAAIGVLGYLGIKKASDVIGGAVSGVENKYSEKINEIKETSSGLSSAISEISAGQSGIKADLGKFAEILAEAKKITATPAGSVVVTGVKKASDVISDAINIPRMVIPGVSAPVAKETVSNTAVKAIELLDKTIPSVNALAVAKAGGTEIYDKYVESLSDTWTENIEAAKKTNAANKSASTSNKTSSQSVTPVTTPKAVAVINNNKSTSQTTASKVVSAATSAASSVAKTASTVASKTVTGQAIKAASSTVNSISKAASSAVSGLTKKIKVLGK